jgi:AraC family transcriptional regulator of adaptative response/methylated-DNA-[protein]-cysteine methyltransferase
MEPNFEKVARAIDYLEAHSQEQPSLARVAGQVGLSEFHFQRMFQRWAGVSPKRFLQVLTLSEAKARLDRSQSLLETSLELGLSGPSRLHDLFLRLESMTPGDYQKQAAGLTLRWGVGQTQLGPALFAATDRGLCSLAFLSTGDETEAVKDLSRRWPRAHLAQDERFVSPYVRGLQERLAGDLDRPLNLLLKGTPLQLRVWEALLRIPEGRVAAYATVAKVAGAPGAARAVGAAVGQNPIAVLIPCHRVIRSTGALSGYRWGAERKASLLGLERARPHSQTASAQTAKMRR